MLELVRRNTDTTYNGVVEKQVGRVEADMLGTAGFKAVSRSVRSTQPHRLLLSAATSNHQH